MLAFHLHATGYHAPLPTFIDGRMDGWMDGMDGRSTFFFGPYLENYFIIFLNCFSSLKYMFLHIFWNIRGKKSECSFFQKISPKSGVGFFSTFWTQIRKFLENNLIFFSDCFWSPQKRFKDIFCEKIKKNNNF